MLYICTALAASELLNAQSQAMDPVLPNKSLLDLLHLH